MTIPGSYYSELMSPADKSCPPQLEFEGNNMEAVAVLLGLLDEKLGQQVIYVFLHFMIWSC